MIVMYWLCYIHACNRFTYPLRGAIGNAGITVLPFDGGSGVAMGNTHHENCRTGVYCITGSCHHNAHVSVAGTLCNRSEDSKQQ